MSRGSNAFMFLVNLLFKGAFWGWALGVCDPCRSATGAKRLWRVATLQCSTLTCQVQLGGGLLWARVLLGLMIQLFHWSRALQTE